MRLIAFIMRYSRAAAILSIVAGLVAGFCNTILLILINTSLSRTLSERQGLGLLFMSVGLLMLISRATSTIMLARLGQNATYHLRLKLSRQILAAPLRHLESVGPARLLTVLTDDVPNIIGGLLQAPLICMNLAVVVGCLVYLAWLSWPVFFGVLAFLIIGLVSYQLPLIKATAYFQQVRAQFDALLRHFRSITDGTKELKLHRRRQEAFFSEILEPTATRLRRLANTGNMIFSFANGWGQLLIFLLVGSLIFLVPNWVSIDSSVLVGYVIVILYMMTPLEVIVNLMPIVTRSQIALQSVERLGLGLSQQIKEHQMDLAAEPAPWKSLELVGVTHTYYLEHDGGNFTMGPIDLSFHPGEMVFVVGGNGSGKTTFAKLLLGLYTPESGELRFNGQSITDENREQFRQYFSAVFSDFFLFENLLGAEASKVDATAQTYLKQFQLDQKVQVKDGRLSSIDLSQGQRKRLALLTAYLEDRPIYLFDEWAADQDPMFKEVFYTQLLPELKARNKTIIVITHDDHYYHLADRLIKLDYGQVEYDTASGAHPAASIPVLRDDTAIGTAD